MNYKVIVEPKADEDFKKIVKSGDKATIKKLDKILDELAFIPKTGIGNPEPLKHHLTGFWSRRLNKKDRLIYQIFEEKVVVIVISALGHYE
jgi:toxin YoeB